MKCIDMIYILAAWLACCCVGCSEDYQEFDEGLASVRFVYERGGEDSLTYSFALHPDVERDTVGVPLQIIGMTSATDRTVAVAVDADLSTAVENRDFIIQKCIVPAKAVKGMLKITILKSGDLEDGDLELVVRLAANADFVEGPEAESAYRIVLTNRMTKPSDWPFGVYSRVKHEFVIKVTGKGTDYAEWKGQVLTYNIGLLNKALYEYNKEHPGEPLTDENGVPVTF